MGYHSLDCVTIYGKGDGIVTPVITLQQKIDRLGKYICNTDNTGLVSIIKNTYTLKTERQPIQQNKGQEIMNNLPKRKLE